MRIKVTLYRTTKQCTLSSITGAIQRKTDFKDIENMLFYCRQLGIVPLVGDCIVKETPRNPLTQQPLSAVKKNLTP